MLVARGYFEFIVGLLVEAEGLFFTDFHELFLPFEHGDSHEFLVFYLNGSQEQPEQYCNGGNGEEPGTSGGFHDELIGRFYGHWGVEYFGD